MDTWKNIDFGKTEKPYVSRLTFEHGVKTKRKKLILWNERIDGPHPKHNQRTDKKVWNPVFSWIVL